MSKGKGNGATTAPPDWDDQTPPHAPPLPELRQLCEDLVNYRNRADNRNLILARVQRQLTMIREPVPAIGRELREFARTVREESHDLSDLAIMADATAGQFEKP